MCIRVYKTPLAQHLFSFKEKNGKHTKRERSPENVPTNTIQIYIAETVEHVLRLFG